MLQTLIPRHVIAFRLHFILCVHCACEELSSQILSHVSVGERARIPRAQLTQNIVTHLVFASLSPKKKVKCIWKAHSKQQWKILVHLIFSPFFVSLFFVCPISLLNIHLKTAMLSMDLHVKWGEVSDIIFYTLLRRSSIGSWYRRSGNVA